MKKSILILLVMILGLLGCSTEPKPFPSGDPTDPPFGCTLLRHRNGEC